MRSILIGAVVLVVFGGVAEAARARCTATRSRGRVLVRVEVADLLDRDLTRLLRLGLQGTIRVDVMLMRSRRLWFDDEIERQSRDHTLAYVRQRGFYLGRRSLRSAQRLVLRAISIGNRVGGEGLYAVVRVRLRVVTSSSLRKTAKWITKKRAGSGVVQQRLIKMVVSDLTRSVAASCGVVAP